MNFLKTSLRGIGQIMFQRSAWTGACFVLGIALHSWVLALATLAGAVWSSALALVLRFPEQEWEDGLYGFNGALVALTGFLFYSSTPLGWAVALLGAALATLLMRGMLILRIAPYTFPFVAVVWLAFWALVPQQPLILGAQNWGESGVLNGFLQSFGQVMFQASTWSGLAFLLGLALSSGRAAFFAALAAALSLVLARGVGWPEAEWAAGLMGYNAVLAVLAMAGVEAVGQAHDGWRYANMFVALLLATALTAVMKLLGLPALTFPFILTCWLLGGLGKLRQVRKFNGRPSSNGFDLF